MFNRERRGFASLTDSSTFVLTVLDHLQDTSGVSGDDSLPRSFYFFFGATALTGLKVFSTNGLASTWGTWHWVQKYRREATSFNFLPSRSVKCVALILAAPVAW